MTRGLSSAQLTAAAARHVAAVALVELHFDSGAIYMALAPWSITYGDDTYYHTGPLASVRALAEAGASFEGIELAMTGLEPAVLGYAATEPYRGRLVRLLKGYLDPQTHALIGPPVVQFIGRMQAMSITETNGTCTAALVAEHYEAELQRPAPLRLNDADQQRLYPGDLGCEFAEEMVEKELIWPAREALMR